MVFLERVFGKSKEEDFTAHDLDGLIARRVEENLNLDYKESKKLEKPHEVAKTISAFANSEGGLLIVGMAMDRPKKFPEHIDWDSDKSHTKEWFEQVAINPIRPRIQGLRVVPVRRTAEGAGEGTVFLIDVPASASPPHMAPDLRYYQRHDFSDQPMEHYQVEDCFGRRRRPVLHSFLEVSEFKDIGGKTTVSARIAVHNKGRATGRYLALEARFRRCTVEAPRKLDKSRMAEWIFEKGMDQNGNSSTRVFYSTMGVIHSEFFTELQPLSVEYINPLPVVEVIVGAEDSTTEHYLTLLGPRRIKRELGRNGGDVKVALPSLQVNEDTTHEQLVEWLEHEFADDIKEYGEQSSKPLELAVMDGVDLARLLRELSRGQRLSRT